MKKRMTHLHHSLHVQLVGRRLLVLAFLLLHERFACVLLMLVPTTQVSVQITPFLSPSVVAMLWGNVSGLHTHKHTHIM